MCFSNSIPLYKTADSFIVYILITTQYSNKSILSPEELVQEAVSNDSTRRSTGKETEMTAHDDNMIVGEYLSTRRLYICF